MFKSETIDIPIKVIFTGVFTVILIIMMFMISGVNDAGHRTVIQYPTGTIVVKFEPGFYWTWFGKETVYQDVLTFDYDKDQSNNDDASIQQTGIAVRYQDGGTGTIYGVTRFDLPKDEKTMVELHKAFRSDSGVAFKLVKPVTEEAMNLTAGLMTSEEAYAEKRSTYTEWSKEQLTKGKFQTEIEEVVQTDETTGKTVVKNVPRIVVGKDGMMVHQKGDLSVYGFTVSGHQIVDWNFEDKTLQQISTKREATMAIITAKAQAEQAKQEAITAEEKGKASVMTAKYEKEVDKEKAIVEAEQKQQVAVIEATQNVLVAEQEKMEAEQKKLAAAEYKEEQELRGEGDGAYKRTVMEADGALEQKLEAWVKINQRYAEAIEKQKWVPDIQFGNTTGTNGVQAQGGNAAMDLIQMFSVKTAKDLLLDMQNIGRPTPVTREAISSANN